MLTRPTHAALGPVRRTGCALPRPDGATDIDVPISVLEAARAAFLRQDVTASLATAFDHAQAPLTVLRPQRLRFVSDDLVVVVRVHAIVGGLSLWVQLSPAGRSTVCARHNGEDIWQDSDDLGRCRLAPVQPGPVSVVIARGRTRTATAWTNIRRDL